MQFRRFSLLQSLQSSLAWAGGKFVKGLKLCFKIAGNPFNFLRNWILWLLCAWAKGRELFKFGQIYFFFRKLDQRILLKIFNCKTRKIYFYFCNGYQQKPTFTLHWCHHSHEDDDRDDHDDPAGHDEEDEHDNDGGMHLRRCGVAGREGRAAGSRSGSPPPYIWATFNSS